MATVNRLNGYSNKNLFECLYGHLTLVLRQTEQSWIFCSSSFCKTNPCGEEKSKNWVKTFYSKSEPSHWTEKQSQPLHDWGLLWSVLLYTGSSGGVLCLAHLFTYYIHAFPLFSLLFNAPSELTVVLVALESVHANMLTMRIPADWCLAGSVFTIFTILPLDTKLSRDW